MAAIFLICLFAADFMKFIWFISAMNPNQFNEAANQIKSRQWMNNVIITVQAWNKWGNEINEIYWKLPELGLHLI